MYEENLERLRRGLDAYNRRDRDAWLVHMDPDVENVPPSVWPEPAPCRGRAAVWDWYVEGGDVWGDGALEVREAIDAGGGRIVAEVAGEVQGEASGALVSWSFWPVVTFRDGLILHIAWFSDRAEALAAAGVRASD